MFADSALDGRAQLFAPGYKFSAAVEYHHPTAWFGRLDASAIGSFYYYTSDSQASSAYNLENARIGYARGSWTTSLWVRNLFDARYAQNGFYFGLIPPNFPNQSFLQLGDPRQVGSDGELSNCTRDAAPPRQDFVRCIAAPIRPADDQDDHGQEGQAESGVLRLPGSLT